MVLGIWGKRAHYTVPWRKFRPFSLFSACVFSSFSDFQSPSLVHQKPHHVLLNTLVFFLHETNLVPSVFQFPPLCLQEHPILFRSLLMALNKYTFWDLTEQAVLFQTTSKAASSKHQS